MDQNNRKYGEGSTITFETKAIKLNLCDYSDVYVLVRGNITVTGGDENTSVTFENCTRFTRCLTHINGKHVETAGNLDIIIPMYILIEYSDNYADTRGSL